MIKTMMEVLFLLFVVALAMVALGLLLYPCPNF
jgi:membrane protein insertase Oxa1/YidC/SpoIIIJ